MNDDIIGPAAMIAIVLVLIVFAVGAFAFFVTTSEIGYDTTQTEEFAVTNPKVAKVCETSELIDTVNNVEQYNGFAWVAVGSGDYTVGAQSVTVSPSGMQG